MGVSIYCLFKVSLASNDMAHYSTKFDIENNDDDDFQSVSFTNFCVLYKSLNKHILIKT